MISSAGEKFYKSRWKSLSDLNVNYIKLASITIQTADIIWQLKSELNSKYLPHIDMHTQTKQMAYRGY